MTYGAHGVSFDYPTGLNMAPGTARAAAERRSCGLQGSALPRRLTGITVTAYRVNETVTVQNIDAVTPAIESEAKQLFGQAGGGMQAGPEKITMAGEAAVRFLGTGITADGSSYTSTIVFAFNGTTEYYVNCQYTPAKAAEVKRACDQLVGSFHEGKAVIAQDNPQVPQGQTKTQAEQAHSDLATLQHDDYFISDLRTLSSDAHQADPDLAATKRDAAFGPDCYDVSTVEIDASNVKEDASIVGLDRDTLTGDLGTASQDLAIVKNDLANLSTSGLPATPGAMAAIAAAGKAIKQAAAEAQVNADVTRAYSVANGMATGSCSGDGPGHPSAPDPPHIRQVVTSSLRPRTGAPARISRGCVAGLACFITDIAPISVEHRVGVDTSSASGPASGPRTAPPGARHVVAYRHERAAQDLQLRVPSSA